MKTYTRLKSKYIDGIPFSNIARTLKKDYPDLEVTIFHDRPNLFKNSGPHLRDASREYWSHLSEAVNKGVKFKVTRDLEKVAKHYSQRDGLYMSAVEPRGILHSILIVDSVQDYATIYDPAELFSNKESWKYTGYMLNTTLGGWGVGVRPKDPRKTKKYSRSVELASHKVNNIIA